MPSGFDFSKAPQLVEVSLTAWSALLNGLIAFLSPCILPLLPVYGIYLLGEGHLTGREKAPVKLLLTRMLGFALGFIPFFMLLGAGAGALGDLLQAHRQTLLYLGGGLMVLFGLMMLDVLSALHLFSIKADARALSGGGFFKMMALGFVLAISWLPCTSPLLSNVLLMAAGTGASATTGMWLLFVYSLGLTLPFLLFMALYAKLNTMLTFLRTHQRIIRHIAGAAMIVYGILQFTGVLQ